MSPSLSSILGLLNDQRSVQVSVGGEGDAPAEGKQNRHGPDGRSNEGEEQKGKFPKDLLMALLHLLGDEGAEKRASVISGHLSIRLSQGLLCRVTFRVA